VSKAHTGTHQNTGSGAKTIEVGSEYRCRMNCSGSKVGSRSARKETQSEGAREGTSGNGVDQYKTSTSASNGIVIISLSSIRMKPSQCQPSPVFGS
jgi:hypothetical protein